MTESTKQDRLAVQDELAKLGISRFKRIDEKGNIHVVNYSLADGADPHDAGAITAALVQHGCFEATVPTVNGTMSYTNPALAPKQRRKSRRRRR